MHEDELSFDEAEAAGVDPRFPHRLSTLTDSERARLDSWRTNRDQGGTDTWPADLDPVTDSAGYLACGCHGSDRDHSCR